MRTTRLLAALAALALALPAGAQTVAWKEVPTPEGAPTPRHEALAAAVGDQIFLIGGRGMRPLDILDLKTGAWRQGAAPPVEINHAQAVTHEGRIYIIGALNGRFPRENVIPRVLIYDPAADRWSEGPALPAGRERGAAGLVVHDGIFYLVAGNRFGHQSGYVPWLDAFDPRTGAWTALPDAPHARDHLAAAVLGGKIYAVGGRRSSQDTGQSFELTEPMMDIYDITTRQWTTAAARLPTPRAGVSAVPIGGMVLVLGGESGLQQAAHAEIEAFDPKSGEWKILPALPVGRHGTQAVVVGKTLHVMSGSRNRGGGPELKDHWTLSGF